MYKLSASLLSAFGLLSLASAQQVPVPEITQGGQGIDSNCNGCYIVADVAGIAFGTETLTGTATNIVSVTTGRNGSFTTTSVVFDVGQFTAASGNAASPGGAGGAATAYNTEGTTVVLNGVTLTSPTAYNVFTAYSVTSSVVSNGACKAVYGTAMTLSSAFKVPIPASVNQDNFKSFQYQAEQQFISFLGSQQCSPGGENYNPTTQVPVDVTTTAVTTVASGTRVPRPATVATTAATTTGPTSSFIAFSAIANASASTYLPGGTGTIIINGTFGGQPSYTIVEAGAVPQSSVLGSWFAGLAALVAGLVA